MTSMWISPVVLERLAGSLLHFVWQGAAIALVAAAALRLLRGKPAEWRYAAAAAGLCAMFAAPFITFAFYAETGALTSRLLRGLNAAAVAASEASAPSGEDITAWTQRIVFVWGIGVAVFLARLAGGWILSRRVLRAASAVVTPVVTEALEQARAGLNFHGKVRVLSGEHIETPVVIGWLRPAILLPVSALTGLSPDHLLAILAHELAHIRRHDFFVNGLQRAVECVLFYHPAVWWVSRRMRVERELCCDDLAVRVCRNRLVYANALVALEDARIAAPLLALPTAGAGVADRVRRILGIHANRDWQSVAAALTFTAILLGAGMWQPPTIAAAPPAALKAQTPSPKPAPLSALIAIATAETVRAAEPAQTPRVTQPSIAASREAARDRLGMLRVEYSAESFVKQAAEGDTIAIKTFLAAGMNINARNETGYTALMKAAAAGHTETVQSLLAAGANPNLTGWQGNGSALSVAAEKGDVSTMKVLIAGGAQVDLKVGTYGSNVEDTPLILAAANGQRDAVILLLDNKASIEAKSNRGTALVAAANTLKFDVMRTLLDRGADINASDSEGMTALHRAAMRNPEGTQLLLDRGANVNARSGAGYTPLMAAISAITNFPTFPSAKAGALFLIERGADVNAASAGTTPLYLAAEARQTDVVRALLAKGADPKANGSNALFAALRHLQRGGSEIATLLIAKGADVNATQNGMTPLVVAVQAQQIDVVRALLAKGADPNVQNGLRQTPLQAAAGHPEIRQLLLNAGAK